MGTKWLQSGYKVGTKWVQSWNKVGTKWRMTTLALVTDHQNTDHLLSDFSKLILSGSFVYVAQKKSRGGSKDEFQEQRNRDFGPFWSDGLVMVRYNTAPDAPGPSFPPFGLLRHNLSCFWGAQMATSLVHQRIISVSSDASQALYESQPNCQWTPYADFSNLDNVAVVPLFVQKPNNKETNRLVFFSPPWLASEMVV